MIDLDSLFNALDVKADWIGLRYVREHVKTRSARNGRLDPISSLIDD